MKEKFQINVFISLIMVSNNYTTLMWKKIVFFHCNDFHLCLLWDGPTLMFHKNKLCNAWVWDTFSWSEANKLHQKKIIKCPTCDLLCFKTLCRKQRGMREKQTCLRGYHSLCANVSRTGNKSVFIPVCCSITKQGNYFSNSM